MVAGRFLVVHSPLSVARDFIDYPYFANLGAVQLAGVLRGAGHAVELVDGFALAGAGLRWRPDGRADLGAPVSTVVEAAAAAAGRLGSVDGVVVVLTPFHRPGRRCDRLGPVIAGVAAAVPAPLLLADAYQSGQHYLEADGAAVLGAYPEVHAWVKYEAEVTVVGLAAALTAGQEVAAGVHHGARPELDDLPFPAWDLCDLDRYQRFHASVVAESGRGDWAFPIDGRTLPLVSSRGCPFACVHCSSNPDRHAEPAQPKDQRRYSSVRLAAYFDELTGRHGATRLALLDDLANASRGHFERLLGHLVSRGVRFDFPNGLRADQLDREQLAALRDHVTTLSISAESGCQRVVDEIIGKRLDLDRVAAVARDARDLGIPLLVHYLFGLPGETAAEINQTLHFAIDLFQRFGARPALQYATPLPGTDLARGAGDDHPDDWAPRFQRGPGHPHATVPAELLERFQWTFDQRLAASAGPRKLILNLTYRCNNHCLFCAVGNRAKVDASPARIRDQLRNYRDLGVRMVDFDGGEPTLHPGLIPLIGHARSLGYQRITVTTNGRLCYYPDFANRLVGSGLTTLLFSVHGGDAATHARHVDVAEAFVQTIGGITNCRAAAPPGLEIGINTTITRHNFDRLEAIAELCCELGLGWLNLQFLTPFGRATVALAPTLAAAAANVGRLIDRFADRLAIQVINLPFCALPGYQRHLAGDLHKLERHMVFVDDQAVNLAHYLAERRRPAPECDDCPHAIFCGGFYDLVVVPDPPWPAAETGTSSDVP